MSTTNWYFTSMSREYGTETFGAYDSHEDASLAIIRVMDRARELNDGIARCYSDPYAEELKTNDMIERGELNA